MTATQLITRSGGWPNSVFLTPDLKPFFAGTYFPPRGRSGPARLSPGAPGREGDVAAAASRGDAAGGDASPRRWRSPWPGSGTGIGRPARTRAWRTGCRPSWPPGSTAGPGGFGPAPKFPSPVEPRVPARSGRGRGRPADARGHPRPHGPGRAHGSAGRGLPPLLDRRAPGSCPTSRRCCTTTRRWPGSTPRPLPSPRAPGFDRVARVTLDFVLEAMTSDEGGLPLGDRRRDRRPRGRVLHLDRPRSSTRHAPRGRRRALPGLLRPGGAASLRGRPLRPPPARPAPGAARRVRARRRSELWGLLEPGRRALLGRPRSAGTRPSSTTRC